MAPLAGQTILYDCTICPNLDQLKGFIPPFMFVDNRDIIPGIVNNCIPDLHPKDVSLKITESIVVVIKNVEICIAKNFEKNLLLFASRFRANKLTGIIHIYF